MILSFSYKKLEDVPETFVRVSLTEEARGSKKLVKERNLTFLEIGAGKPEEMSLRRFMLLCRSIIRIARELKAKKIAVQFDRTPELFKNLKDISPEDISLIAAENYEMANYEFTDFKTPPKEGWTNVEEIALCGKSSTSMERAAKRGQLIGREVNRCRTLANTPGKDMTPKKLAEAAKTAAKGTKVKIKVLGKLEMQKLGMEAVLGIARGSDEEPQFIILEYKGAAASKKPLVLIGKGVTFDSGGLSLKPADSMFEMHLDMSGGAAVIHSIILAEKLKLKANVVGLVPAVENMPSGGALHPGDILKSLSGKTIEILNTDAEGRVILADAITYAKRYEPTAVIECSTLTGAALVALGQQASGLMTTDKKLEQKIINLGEKSGDYVWPFPLWEEYEDMVKGNFGDIPNISTAGNSRHGGVIAGGMFLREFAKELKCPFAHIDIAPRMSAAPNEYLAKGAPGAPVRLLTALIEGF